MKMTKRLLRSTLRRNGWKLGASARELKISGQELSWHLEQLQMKSEADAERMKNRVPGPRRGLQRSDVDADRDRLVRALVAEGSYRMAAVALKISRRSLYRKVSDYGITKTKIDHLRRNAAK